MSSAAFAQTSTTVTTQPPPPPPSSTTTVTTQPAPAPQPGTQVVVNPNPGTTTASAPTAVETVHSGRAPAAIVATDALYGGVAGALVGGGVALINSGNNWQRDLMVGGGVGLLVGAAFGIYDALNDHSSTAVVRAAADRNPAESTTGLSAKVYAARF